MHAMKIKASRLDNYEACQQAIDGIESDYVNYEGGLQTWSDGSQAVLRPSAENKICAIRKRQDELEAIRVLKIVALVRSMLS